MAVTIDWSTYTISVPRDDLTLVQEIPTFVYDLDIDWFRKQLKDLEDSELGMVNPDTHSHNTEVTLSGLTYARVVEILDPYSITFEDGQYGVNLVGANSNIADKINVNQVSVRSQNSAGLISSPDIEYASFQSGVWIDVVEGNDENKGNEQLPVKTIERALIVASYRGFKRLYVQSDLTIGAGSNIEDFSIVGQSHVFTDLHIEDSAECARIKIENCTFTGILDGDTELTACIIGDCQYVNGHIHGCELLGTIELGGNKKALIANCTTVDQDNPPVIDMGGTGQSLSMPNYSGVISIRNLTDATQEIGLGLDAGLITLEDTISAGTIIVAGIGTMEDNTTGTAIVNTDSLLNRELITKSSWDLIYYDSVNGEPGTNFPVGTLTNPVNNLTDLLAIAAKNDLHKIQLITSMTLDQPLQGFRVTGGSGLILDANGFSLYGCILENLRVEGNLIPLPFFAQECSIGYVTGLVGFYESCWFLYDDPITVASDQNVLLSRCWSYIPGSGSPVLDFSNGNIKFNMRAYSGGVRVINSTDSNNISTFEFIAGKFNFGADNTAGNFQIRGVIDPSGIDYNTTADIVHTGSVSTNRELQYQNKLYLDPVNGIDSSAYPAGLSNASGACKNLDDALSIMSEFGLTELNIDGDITIPNGTDISGITIKAARSLGNSVTVEAGAITNETYFENINVTGTMNGPVIYTSSILGEINNFDGGASDCQLTAAVNITGTGANYLTNCDTYVSDAEAHNIINLNGNPLNIIRCRGNYEIVGKTNLDTTSIDLVSGAVHITDSCTSGIISVNSEPEIIDESLDTCTVQVIAGSNAYLDSLVYVNTELAINGDGRSGSPFNSFPAAVDFCEERGWRKIILLSDVTVDRTLKNFIIEGTGLPTINFNGQNVDKSEFLKVQLTGQQVGSITAREVILLDGLTDINGVYKEIGMGGAIQLADNCEVVLVDANSVIPGTSSPTVDFVAGYTNQSLNIRQYSGGLLVKNMDDVSNISTIEYGAGRCQIDPTCTAGLLSVRGIPFSALYGALDAGVTLELSAMLPDAATNADVVWDEQVSEHQEVGSTGEKLGEASSGGVNYNDLADAVWTASEAIQVIGDTEDARKYSSNKAVINSDGTQVTIYEDNGVTPWKTFSISSDRKIRTPA